MKLNLSDFFTMLAIKKNFYGRLAMSMQRLARPGMGTMAVGIREGRVTFYYDPAFIADIPMKAAMFALEHEMLHVVLDHIPRYLELLALCATDEERAKAAAVYNIAMDAADNNLLRNHEGIGEIQTFLLERLEVDHPGAKDDPRNGIVLPEKFDLPVDGHFELYQWLLMQRVQIVQIAAGLLGPNTHEMWTKEGQDGQGGEGEGEGNAKSDGDDDGDGESRGQGAGAGGLDAKDMMFGGSTFADMSPEELNQQAHRVRESIKQALRDVVRSMGGVGRGTIPAGIEEWLAAYLAPAVVPWWEIFTTRARMSRNSKFRRSVSVPNRALLALSEEDPKIIPAPGRLRDKAWRIFLYVDTSGSMGTESLEIVKSELGHMLSVDENMEIRYMQGDAATHMDVVLHTGDAIPGQMLGRGGTDFDAYFIHMGQYMSDDDKAPDLVIVYTDGYAPPVAHKNRLPPDVPVIWLVTPGHSTYFHQNYGEIIVCDPEHNDRYKKAA